MSESDFLSSLNIQVEVFVPKEEHFQRVAQLINKTNQFNLTTRRCTQSEVEELASRPGSQVLAMRVFDRFGNYGLVGVAIVKNSFGKTWELDSFLVSCRVLGRKVEDAFLSAVTRYCCDQGAESLLGHYLPTAKNQVAEDFLPKHGFSSHENGWILSLEKPLPVPEYVGLLLLNAPEAENV
jgi:FkbH-like protein